MSTNLMSRSPPRSAPPSYGDRCKPCAVSGLGALLVAGIRIAVGRAIIGVIVAELYHVGVTGLGARMTYYSNFFQVANYFAALLVFILFSVAATEAAPALSNTVSRWR